MAEKGVSGFIRECGVFRKRKQQIVDNLIFKTFVAFGTTLVKNFIKKKTPAKYNRPSSNRKLEAALQGEQYGRSVYILITPNTIA